MRNMKKFFVTMPIVGSITTEVEASDKKQAVEEAWKIYHEQGPEAGEVEWEVVSRITTGNVLHAPLNEISVSEPRIPKQDRDNAT